MAAAVILDNFEWLYLRNGSRSTYIARDSAHRAVIFAIEQLSCFKDMFDRMPKIVGSRDLGHAHFRGKLLVRSLGIPDTKLHAKFEVSSSSSFRDIAL